METGAKLNVTKTIRSSKTGMLLPRKATLVSVTEIVGRTLLLVKFEDGQQDYLFDMRSKSTMAMHQSGNMVQILMRA